MARRSDHSRDELYRMALDATREIVRDEGVKALSARRVATRIGYSAGTLYNVFKNQDDMIVRLNGETLDALYTALEAGMPADGDVEANLLALAQGYIAFTLENRDLWNVIFEHRLSPGVKVPGWYLEKLDRLLGLIEAALAPVFPEDDAGCRRAARVLWSGVHGICTLGQAGKLSLVGADNTEEMAANLVRTYLAGLRKG